MRVAVTLWVKCWKLEIGSERKNEGELVSEGISNAIVISLWASDDWNHSNRFSKSLSSTERFLATVMMMRLSRALRNERIEPEPYLSHQLISGFYRELQKFSIVESVRMSCLLSMLLSQVNMSRRELLSAREFYLHSAIVSVFISNEICSEMEAGPSTFPSVSITLPNDGMQRWSDHRISSLSTLDDQRSVSIQYSFFNYRN